MKFVVVHHGVCESVTRNYFHEVLTIPTGLFKIESNYVSEVSMFYTTHILLPTMLMQNIEESPAGTSFSGGIC